MKYVFISYSHEDGVLTHLVALIKSVLEKLQIDVWIDRRSIDGGEDWRRSIDSGIKGAAVFIACLSQNYFKNSRSYIRNELEIAFRELDTRDCDKSWFIPLKIGNYESSSVPSQFLKQLNDLHMIDLSGGVEEGFSDLLNVILPIVKPNIHWLFVLRRLLAQQIASQIDHFTSSGTMRFEQIEDRWLSLSEESVVKPLSTLFIQVLEKAKLTQCQQTERLVLQDKNVLITCIPHLDPMRYKQSLSTKGSELSDQYLQFVLDNVRTLRNTKGWQEVDFVHILYFTDGSDWILDILYVISFNLTMTIFGYFATLNEHRLNSDEKVAITYEELYPTYVTNSLEYTKFANLLRQEEVVSDKEIKSRGKSCTK